MWDDEMLNSSMPVEDYGLDALKGAHILVTTPKYLAPISERGHVPLGNARVLVVDEADVCLSGALVLRRCCSVLQCVAAR